jgi:uncharacterized integral membrane protein
VTQAPEERRKPDRDRTHDLQVATVTLAVVLLVWFVLANTQKVRVHFWFFTANVSLIVVILISAALGALCTLLLGHSSRRRAAKRAKRD